MEVLREKEMQALAEDPLFYIKGLHAYLARAYWQNCSLGSVRDQSPKVLANDPDFKTEWCGTTNWAKKYPVCLCVFVCVCVCVFKITAVGTPIIWCIGPLSLTVK